MLLGNHSVIHKSPGRFLGGTSVSNVPSNFQKNGHLQAIYSQVSIPDQWGLPVGYYTGWMLPRTAGYISGVNSLNAYFNTNGNIVSGINMTANANILINAFANLALIVSVIGTANLSITTSANIAGVIFGNGTTSLSISTSALIGAIQNIAASASFNMTINAFIRANGYMNGAITPFAELSPQTLASAVWSALATENNTAGSMGSKLNTASSGGIDINALAQAVWEYSIRTLTVTGGLTPEQAIQLANTVTKDSLIIDTDSGSASIFV